MITNHNYAEYLPAALRSALGQRGADVEVVVVDDGSTDSSREVIASFGDGVRAILQPNSGQKGAINAGFAAATGDAVVFLDADDELAPDAAAAVADAFASHPEAGRVVFRLQVVDSRGRPTGACVPPLHVPLGDGDVRSAVLRFPDDLAWPPMSGNAFAAWVLREVLPLPVDDDREGADYLLHASTPLLAPVVALERIGGNYRLHDRNSHFRPSFDVARSRYLLRRSGETHAAIALIATRLGLGSPHPRSVTIAAHRLVSLRLDPRLHPLIDDGRARALLAGARAAIGRSDVSFARRLVYLGWFAATALAPRRVVPALAEAALQPRRPSWRPRR